MTKTFRQEFRARLDDLEAIRDFVGASARALGLDSTAVDELQLCVDEAATNIAEYGYADVAGNLSIEVHREHDQIVVRILDDAAPFDLESVARPALDIPLHQRPIGGMGVHLIRTLTDGLVHRLRPEGGNELVMRKDVNGRTEL